jgi:hypothetical protein
VGKPSHPQPQKREREKNKKATVSILKISTVLAREIPGSRIYVPSRRPGFEVVCDFGDGDKHQKAKIDRRSRAAATEELPCYGQLIQFVFILVGFSPCSHWFLFSFADGANLSFEFRYGKRLSH